jgi:hypothetical protein
MKAAKRKKPCYEIVNGILFPIRLRGYYRLIIHVVARTTPAAGLTKK